ncbi:MAG TPA: VTT domain-containing protein [Kiritimatiellia bacterium]|nr:VTT domain-containing protein [Kiritimatiellia bacterium]
MSLAILVSTYGYAAIALGAFFEGETVLVLGGLAASQGYLALPGVCAAAFLSTLCADLVWFHLGRAKGPALLEKRPSWKARSAKLFARVRRHQNLVLLSFRFCYGLRTLTPLALGATGTSRRRFLLLDLLGAGAWAAAYAALGYLFGGTAQAILGDVRRYELRIFAAVAVVGGLVWLVHRRPRPVLRST